jgi:hypothetical protein
MLGMNTLRAIAGGKLFTKVSDAPAPNRWPVESGKQMAAAHRVSVRVQRPQTPGWSSYSSSLRNCALSRRICSLTRRCGWTASPGAA